MEFYWYGFQYIFKCHIFSVVEITEENLEDLLAYDDLFLDYYNAFLALPVGTLYNVHSTKPNCVGNEFTQDYIKIKYFRI